MNLNISSYVNHRNYSNTRQDPSSVGAGWNATQCGNPDVIPAWSDCGFCMCSSTPPLHFARFPLTTELLAVPLNTSHQPGPVSGNNRLYLKHFGPLKPFFSPKLVLGAFAKLRKATISFVTSVCPHGTARLPLYGFWRNLIFQTFSKICRGN